MMVANSTSRAYAKLKMREIHNQQKRELSEGPMAADLFRGGQPKFPLLMPVGDNPAALPYSPSRGALRDDGSELDSVLRQPGDRGEKGPYEVEYSKIFKRNMGAKSKGGKARRKPHGKHTTSYKRPRPAAGFHDKVGSLTERGKANLPALTYASDSCVEGREKYGSHRNKAKPRPNSSEGLRTKLPSLSKVLANDAQLAQFVEKRFLDSQWKEPKGKILPRTGLQLPNLPNGGDTLDEVAYSNSASGGLTRNESASFEQVEIDMKLHDAAVKKRDNLKKKVELKKKIQEQRVVQDGAVMIQKVFRQKLAREEVCHAKERKVQKDGAVMIQKTFRQKRAREEVVHIKEEGGALMIQKTFRKKAAKNEVNQKKQAKDKEVKAVMVLQNCVRAHFKKHGFADLVREAQAATGIQAIIRKRMVQGRIQKMLKAKREKLQKLKQSGMLIALPGTTQGKTGWYQRGEDVDAHLIIYCEHNETNGKWACLLGPVHEDAKVALIRAAKKAGRPVKCADIITEVPDHYHVDASGHLMIVKVDDPTEMHTKAIDLQKFVRQKMIQKHVRAAMLDKRKKLKKLRGKNMLIALPGTQQGKTGWYESPNNTENESMCIYCDHNEKTDAWRCLLGPLEEDLKFKMIRKAKRTGKLTRCKDYLSGVPDSYHITKRGQLVAVRRKAPATPNKTRQSRVGRQTRVDNARRQTRKETGNPPGKNQKALENRLEVRKRASQIGGGATPTAPLSARKTMRGQTDANRSSRRQKTLVEPNERRALSKRQTAVAPKTPVSPRKTIVDRGGTRGSRIKQDAPSARRRTAAGSDKAGPSRKSTASARTESGRRSTRASSTRKSVAGSEHRSTRTGTGRKSKLNPVAEVRVKAPSPASQS
jgi:hypothetical protein